MAENQKQDNKGKRLWITAIIAAIVVSAGAGYCIGRQQGYLIDKSEDELNVRLNLSDLEGLGEIEGPIYVTGHKSPDTDTVGSSIGYAALLQKLGYDAHAVVLGDINKETRLVLEKAGVEIPPLLEDASGCNMVLMDHSEYSQSADGLQDANIISIIDHHGDGSVFTANQIIYDARPLGSTATIVWLRYRNYGQKPDKDVAYAMLGSILSDTRNFQGNVTEADREAAKELSSIAGITDFDSLYTEMYKALISHEGMTDEEIFFSDYKEYTAGGFNYSIGCVNVYDEEEAKELAGRMKTFMPSTKASTGMDMTFTQIGILHDDVSVSYLVPADDIADDVLKQAYGDTAEYDGTSYILRPGISRKKHLVPAITDILESYPKEN